MADLNFKSTIDRTMKVTKKYVDTLVEALDVNKQNKLTYEDDLEEYKRFTTAEAEVTAPINVGVFCSVASLNLEIGKTYNLKTLVSTEIPTNLSEDLTKNVRSNDKMLVEFTATAIKDEAASEVLGQEIISLSYDYNDCAYDIIVYDKVMLQVNEETGDISTIYSEDHAVISIPFVADYLEIGLKKQIKEDLSNDFLKTYKFVTQEDKDNWNNKQDKVKNGVFIKQTPPADVYGYDKLHLITNILEDGLYMATNELSFYEETTLLEGGAELSNGKKDCSFHVYTGHLFQYTKIGYHTEYCYITNLTTGITCCLDAEGGITGIDANNGFMYLDDVQKLLQYEEIVLELYESDRTGTVNMGTSSKEYQFNNAGFLFEENALYHVVFEDLDGKMTEITGKAEYDGQFFGNRILAISDWDNPLTPETHLSSDGTSMIFNIDVENSLEYNGFGKVTVLKVDYVSTEFLETHRFVTEEEKENWNNKADKEYVDEEMAGLASVATSGSYNDLKNKPTIKKSDWGENDTSDAAYIYGRTHWKEKRYGPETEFGQIAQSYGYWNSNEPDNIIYASTIVPPLGRPVIRLEVGTTYTVTIDRYDDGTVDEYECVCQQHSEYEYIKVLGDTSFSTMPVYIEDDGDRTTASLQYGGDNINVTISGQRPIENEVYHKLSMDYLPSNVATKEYVNGNQVVETVPYNKELSTTNTLYVDVTTLTTKKWYAITEEIKKFTILIVYYKPANSEERIQICRYTTPYNLRICCSASSASRVAFYVVTPQESKYYDVTLNDDPALVSHTQSLRLAPVTNTTEFTPTNKYNLVHKQYADDVLLTDYYEELFTITQAELDSSNNGSAGVNLEKVKAFDSNGFNKDCIYYGYYQDKVIRLTYSEQFDTFYCNSMDKNGSQSIGICFHPSNGNIIPLNSGTQDVKDYKFTGDLVVKKRLRIDPNSAATKKYVDDNKDFIHLVGTTENPITLTDLELGRYLVSGPVKFHPGLGAVNIQNENNYQITIGMKNASAIRGSIMVNGLLGRFHYNYDTQEWFRSDYVTRAEVLTLTNTTEFIPTNDYHPVTKKYVDEAIANASLGGGGDVSDSGVIEDSEFDDLISDTFGPEYVSKDE